MSLLIDMEHWPTDRARLERYCDGESTDADMLVQAERVRALHGKSRREAAVEAAAEAADEQPSVTWWTWWAT